MKMLVDGIAKALYSATGIPCTSYEREGVPTYPYFYIDLVTCDHDQLGMNLNAFTWRFAIYYYNDSNSDNSKLNKDTSVDMFGTVYEALKMITLSNGTKLMGEEFNAQYVDGLMHVGVTYITDFKEDYNNVKMAEMVVEIDGK